MYQTDWFLNVPLQLSARISPPLSRYHISKNSDPSQANHLLIQRLKGTLLVVKRDGLLRAGQSIATLALAENNMKRRGGGALLKLLKIIRSQ